jgi:guanylate kinase
MFQMDQEALELIRNYKTPESVIERLGPIRTVILSGISAAGKDTIQKALAADGEYSRVVTSTTRAPRENDGILETNGVEYYFFTLEQAKQKMRDGEYIEVMNVHGRANGSLIKEYERISLIGSIALSDIDYQGAARFLEFGMQRLSTIFVIPPSYQVWFERLTKRYGNSLSEHQDEIINRMRSAQKEIAFARADRRFLPVVNDDIERVSQEIHGIVASTIQLSDEDFNERYMIMDELLAGIDQYLELND